VTGLLVSQSGGVLRLCIDRPERRNALSDELATAICEALAATDARVVLLSSSGDRVFCAGADLSVMSAPAGGSRGGVRRVVEAMRACPAPVVVRVQGLCLAGGVGLILGADVVIASDNVELGLPEVDRGLWPFMVGVLLAQHVSPKIAMDLMLTGRRVPAGEALSLGLLSRVVPADRLDDEVEDVLATLAAAAPLAVQQGKQAYLELLDTGDALVRMEERITRLSQSADAAEGIAAFREKRPPHWQGR
jgi:enoyl-CoA hydratase/carnithine racemase